MTKVRELVDIARDFQQLLPGRLVYFNDTFYVWTGTRYRPYETRDFKRLVQEIDRRNQLDLTVTLLNKLIAQLRIEANLTTDQTPPFYLHDDAQQIRRADHVIPLANKLLQATYDTGDIEVLEPTPDLFTDFTLNATYDPDADCPLFRKCLAEWFLDDTQQKLVWQFLAYLLLPTNRFKKIFIFYGEKDCGKTLLQHVVQDLLGRRLVAGIPLQKLGANERQSLPGKYVNFASEAKYHDANVCEELKMYSGGDLVTTDRKYISGIDYEPSVRLVITGNAEPYFPTDDAALWERLILFHFHKPASSDVNLRKKLQNELPGILNGALAALPDLLVNGFLECSTSQQFLHDCRTQHDNVYRFVTEKVYFPAANQEQRFESKDDVYTVYRHWCEAVEGSKGLLGKPRFWQRFKQICADEGRPLTETRPVRGGKRVYEIGPLWCEAMESKGGFLADLQPRKYRAEAARSQEETRICSERDPAVAH